VPNPTLALFVQSLMPSSDHIALITGLVSGAMALGGALGAPILGAWGDRLGHVRLIAGCAVLGIVGFVPQALAPSVIWVVPCQFVVGVAQGGTLANSLALLAGVAKGGHEGTVFGLDASAGGIAASAGPLIGATVGASLGLRAPFLFSAAILAAAAALVTSRVREPRSPQAPVAAVRPG
jgi:MFS transporter, DHA1 family, multidrug resistance protein